MAFPVTTCATIDMVHVCTELSRWDTDRKKTKVSPPEEFADQDRLAAVHARDAPEQSSVQI